MINNPSPDYAPDPTVTSQWALFPLKLNCAEEATIQTAAIQDPNRLYRRATVGQAAAWATGIWPVVTVKQIWSS